MRVVLNALAALKPKTGVGVYVAELSAAIQRRRDVSLAVYPDADLARIASRGYRLIGSGGGGKGGSSVVGHMAHAAKHLGKIAVGVHFARTCRAAGFDLYHEPNFVPLPCDLPTVVTVHDLSVLLYPQWHPADRVRHHETHFAAAVKRSAHLICVSEHVRSEVIHAFGVRPSKVTAVPNGVSPAFRPLAKSVVDECRERLHLPSRYLLCVGTVEPRKNLMTVLRAFVDLPAATRERCPLVLAGPWGWKSDQDREYFETTARTAGVIRLGYVAAADLPALYNGASALLYPSFYEGFGLPPVEMLACGGAVVCSAEAAAVGEVVGSFGTFLPASDVRAWRDAMRRIAAGEPTTPVGGVAHANRYTWDRTADETIGVYDRVSGCRRARSAA
jgi:glycosyltransferase involved in cell wall biosynthesis